MKLHKSSKQREAILNILRDTKTHPTADWIYNQAKEIFGNISFGTVYRNLNILQELELIVKISIGDGIERYDACVSNHSHFICEKCGVVRDVDLNQSDVKMRDIQNTIDISKYRINRIRVDFFGICDTCGNISI